MSETGFVARERALLGRLVPLVAERAALEASAEKMLAEATATAEREHRRAVASAEARCEAERRGAADELKMIGDSLRESHELKRSAAVRAMEQEVGAFLERTNAIESAATQELEEASWLAETVVESAERKMQQDFATVSKIVSAGEKDAGEIRREGELLLRKHGHAGLGEAATVLPESGACDGPRFEAARASAMARLGRLSGVLNHWATRLSTLVAALVLAGVAGPVAARLLWPRAEFVTSAATGAGVGIGVVVVAYLVAGWLIRLRVRPASIALGESLSRLEAMGKGWLADAEAERDRQATLVRQKREGEIRKAKERFSTIKGEVQRRRRVDEPALRQRHESAIAALRRDHESHLHEAEEVARERTMLAERERERAVSAGESQKRAALDEAERVHVAAREAVATLWNPGLGECEREGEALCRAAAEVSLGWGDSVWLSPRPAAGIPGGVRFGALEVDLSAMSGGLPVMAGLAQPASRVIELPVMLDLLGKGSLLIQSGSEGRAVALRTLENILLRLLTAFPPGKVRFTIIDPVGLGQSFAGFMHLADYEEGLVGDKIWTDPRRIEQKLGDLTEHMENVIQKYLRNEFATIQDYNEAAGEVAEPFRFLVISDFPAGISEASAKRIASIASSGARCGVYTLIACDTRQKPQAFVPMGELERASEVLSWKQGRLVWQDEAFSRWPLRLEEPPKGEAFTSLIHAVGRFAKDSSRVQVPFEVVAPTPSKRWSASADERLEVPIGRAGATKLQALTLGRGTQQHALIAGRTGSGKSTLLHAIITNLSLWFSPDEVEYYLVDFKKGVEFKTYATHRVPHARVVAVESEREFGLSVLRRLDAELSRRGQLFREAGVQDLASYRRHARGAGIGKSPLPMPRTLLIVDEFQEFFVEDDKLAQESALLLDRLVRQGRAFGIHVILGSQTIGGAYSLARSTIGQMAVRIALQCSESDSYLILSEDNNAARLLSRPGEAIYNDASGLVEGNSPFQVVWLSDEKRDGFLKELGPLVGVSGLAPPPPPVVFEGNVPADISRLAALLSRPASGVPRAYLGEPISIKEPTSIQFRKQSGGNAVVLGQQERSAAALVVSSVLSLVCGAVRGERVVELLDSGDAENDQTPVLRELASALGSVVRYSGVADAEHVIAGVHAELTTRGPDAPRRYVIVHGLQRFRALRRNEAEYSFGDDGAATTTDKQFAAILRDGPSRGVHVVATCDTLSNLERAVDRRGLREFGSRVLFQMSGADSSALIDSPQAVNLGQHRALLYTEELGSAEKFRPFAVADGAVMRELAATSRGPSARPSPR